MLRPSYWIALPLAFVVFGCKDDKKDAVAVAPAATSLAPSKAEPNAMSARYVLSASGKTSIDMPAPQERIKAATSASAGTLDVDLRDLSKTRGEVKIDLTTLVTSTFDDPSKNSAQTEHARTWLEVIGEKVPQEKRENHRWVVFAIRSIEDLSAKDLTQVAAQKDKDGEVRAVTLKAKGDFLLHGHKVENKEASLEAKFHYPAGAPADSKPGRLQITSRSPMLITLAEHEVKPRDALGILAEKSFSLLGTKVADVANVSLDLDAKLSN